MKKPSEPHKYMFPNAMARMMKNVDMKTQLEASMMSMFMLLLGMILMSVYTFLYLSQGMVFKILLIFNLLAGFIFMSSFLVTTYQQYNSYMSIMQLQTQTPGEQIPIKLKYKKSRKNQFKFFLGLILIICSSLPMYVSTLPTYILDYKYYILGVGVLLGLLLDISALKKKNSPNLQLSAQSQVQSKQQEEIKINNQLNPNFSPKKETKLDSKQEERLKVLINALKEKLADIERMKAERR